MSLRNGNVLVVDDIKENIRILAQALESEGYTVRPALTGQIALEAARKESPDLILLDIMMPGMNGYQVCEALKSEARLKDVPVIFISALDEVTDKMKGFAAGGVDYISKPFQMEEVLARVETHLTLGYLRKELEDKNIRLQEANEELQNALNEIKTLRGILPICSYCKKIRNDDDSWHTMEKYISDHSDVQFSHGICQDCAQKYYPDLISSDD
ncbi:MAG: response regulator [Proteobacteria bacterium]|nr:response regulator [Pseudomonadota bacterium]MBU1418943.1 response regulator [Pseudomonadota bacterium]MBU1453594.1 response regulator [Pseudomonadota bacterium]